jgi:hypothetical protein
LFQGAFDWPTALFVLGIVVVALSTSALALRFAVSSRAIPISAETPELVTPAAVAG